MKFFTSHLSITLLILNILFLSSSDSFAKKVKYHPRYSTMVPVKNRTQKHFDIDKDDYLNRYENSLYNTHLLFGYPLAKKKKHKPYDYNHDLMLGPFEMQLYLKDKKNGRLKKYVKKNDKKAVIIDGKKRR